MKLAVLVGMVGLLWHGTPTTTAARTYWIVPLDTIAIGHLKHTHVSVTGRVAYCLNEGDGDKHVKLMSPTGSGRFIVAEWIPLLPLAKCPAVNSTITVRGISRVDPDHGWSEVHPVESFTAVGL